MGRYDEALRTHHKAYTFAREHGLRHRMANALQVMGESHHALAQKKLNAALHHFQDLHADADVAEVTTFMKENGYQVEPAPIIKEDN
jgi:hypothetical protein